MKLCAGNFGNPQFEAGNTCRQTNSPLIPPLLNDSTEPELGPTDSNFSVA